MVETPPKTRRKRGEKREPRPLRRERPMPKGRSRQATPPPRNFETVPVTLGSMRNYHPTIARKICERIMMGDPLKTICQDKRFPSQSTVVKWLAHPDATAFREAYYYARRVYAELLIEDIIEIADDSSNDWKPIHNRNGDIVGHRPDNEAIQRSRVRIDTRKWLATKMLPRIYGDNIEIGLSAKGSLEKLLEQVTDTTTGIPSEQGNLIEHGGLDDGIDDGDE